MVQFLATSATAPSIDFGKVAMLMRMRDHISAARLCTRSCCHTFPKWRTAWTARTTARQDVVKNTSSDDNFYSATNHREAKSREEPHSKVIASGHQTLPQNCYLSVFDFTNPK